MNFVLERIIGPTSEPVTLDEAKVHLGVESDDTSRDSQITSLIANAREWVEDETGQALIDQSWRLSLGEVLPNFVLPIYPGRYYSGQCGNGDIYLRRTPTLAITKFVSVDAAGTETAIATSAYALRDASSKWPRIIMLSGFVPWARLVIEFRAGYLDTSGPPATPTTGHIPERFKQSIKLHVEANFDRDEKMMPILLDAASNNVARLVAQIPFA